MLDVVDLQVRYRVTGTLTRSPYVHAVNGVSLSLRRGEALGIVGESGCGKTTLARTICGLVPATSGRIILDGRDLPLRRTRESQRRVQMVFQDPTASLNPRLTIGAMLRELLKVHGLRSGADIEARAAELLQLVELPATVLTRRPRELSGGQRQRIGIARALAVEPEVLVADEAVSALDVSTKAAVITLLDRLRSELGLALIFISHDLGTVRAVCDRVAVMYLGRIVEQGTTDALYSDPQHPYTRALLNAAPRINDTRRPGSARLPGEPPSPLDPPTGCAFHPRCALAAEPCRSHQPEVRDHGGHTAMCHFAWGDLGSPVAATAHASAPAGQRLTPPPSGVSKA
jgi:oligopeptide/dipeptide ABC transporter ATP-binding protein